MWKHPWAIFGMPSLLILDPNAVIFDALTPARLSNIARKAIKEGDAAGTLAICDVTLWEIAMLIHKGRVRVDEDPQAFLNTVITARSLKDLPITPEIAVLFPHRSSRRMPMIQPTGSLAPPRFATGRAWFQVLALKVVWKPQCFKHLTRLLLYTAGRECYPGGLCVRIETSPLLR